jgi:hypothetical protein
MDVLAMKRQGMSFKEIATGTGYHPATISKCVREGGPPAARTVADEDRVIDPRWADRLNELLVGNTRLLATSLFEIITAEGFDGSYPTVARWVRDQRGPRFRRADQASVPTRCGRRSRRPPTRKDRCGPRRAVATRRANQGGMETPNAVRRCTNPSARPRRRRQARSSARCLDGRNRSGRGVGAPARRRRWSANRPSPS